MSNQPTAEQIAALADYAAKNGRNWKSKLNDAWMAGGYDVPSGEYIDGVLQEIRNQLGPSWLAKYRPQRVTKNDAFIDMSLGGWR